MQLGQFGFISLKNQFQKASQTSDRYWERIPNFRGRGVQESFEITLRSHEYKTDLRLPAPSPITRQGRTLPKDTEIEDGIGPSKNGSRRCKLGETAPSLSKNSK